MKNPKIRRSYLDADPVAVNLASRFLYQHLKKREESRGYALESAYDVGVPWRDAVYALQSEVDQQGHTMLLDSYISAGVFLDEKCAVPIGLWRELSCRWMRRVARRKYREQVGAVQPIPPVIAPRNPEEPNAKPRVNQEFFKYKTHEARDRAKDALQRCRAYRESTRDAVYWSPVVGYHPEIECPTLRRGHGIRRYVTLPVHWKTQVLDRGLAVVDDHFILSAKPRTGALPEKAVYDVVYLKQAHGLSLKLAEGVVVVAGKVKALGENTAKAIKRVAVVAANNPGIAYETVGA